jgi:hypothetical protein
MALVFKDRVQETSSTTGTGTLTLGGAVSGYQTFSSAIGNTNTTYYAIVNDSEWEVGLGTVSAGQLSRDTVLESSNSNNLVNFSAGTKYVFCTYAADKTVIQDASNKVSGYAIENSTIGATTPSTGRFTTLVATGQSSLATSSGNVQIGSTTATEKLDVSGGGLLVRGTTNQTAGNGGLYLGTSGTASTLTAINPAVQWFNMNFSANQFSFLPQNAEQFRVSHTASAVNYVQVTGNVTGTGTNSAPIISAQGSDGAIGLSLTTKGGESIYLRTNSSARTGFEVGHGGGTVNWLKVIGSVAGNATPLFAQGSDTNISMAFQPKGTGAIDLAAGSSGVNISNGGTVTAITRTAQGIGYSSAPTWSASAPTTAGGVTATGTTAISNSVATATITNGGTGYTVGNVLTFVGGTFTVASQITVTSVSSGVITGISTTIGGIYTVPPTNPISVTGGSGSGATFTLTSYGVNSLVVGNAGSGYIEQPTVTFSGGGGSGAAAYATVGSNTTQKTIGNIHTFATPNSNVLAIVDKNAAGNNPTNTTVAFSMIPQQSAFGASYLGFGSSAYLGTTSSSANAFAFATSVSSPVSNGGGGLTQMQIAHTASAVNYVQVTGAATGQPPAISAQGSDGNVNMTLRSKGTGYIGFTSGAGSGILLGLPNGSANYFTVASSNASSAPILASAGSDTDIDLTLTPKGTGNVRFGTYTASILTPTGFIEVKDSGGTVRRLLVG